MTIPTHTHYHCGFGNDIIYSFIVSFETEPVNMPLRISPDVLSK